MGTTNEQDKLTKLWELWEAGKIDSPLAELMTYQAEINNGGHDQYFLNVGSKAVCLRKWLLWNRFFPRS